MAFNLTKDDLKRGMKCPPGMHVMHITEVEPEYLNDKGTTVQKVFFETTKGYSIPYWFHASDMGKASMFEFIAAADKVKAEDIDDNFGFDPEYYKGKDVAGSVSHGRTKDGKVVAQIDAFYNADNAPF